MTCAANDPFDQSLVRSSAPQCISIKGRRKSAVVAHWICCNATHRRKATLMTLFAFYLCIWIYLYLYFIFVYIYIFYFWFVIWLGAICAVCQISNTAVLYFLFPIFSFPHIFIFPTKIWLDCLFRTQMNLIGCTLSNIEYQFHLPTLDCTVIIKNNKNFQKKVKGPLNFKLDHQSNLATVETGNEKTYQRSAGGKIACQIFTVVSDLGIPKLLKKIKTTLKAMWCDGWWERTNNGFTLWSESLQHFLSYILKSE